MINLLAIFLGSLSIGISITNYIWTKNIQQNNRELFEMLSEMQEDFYKKIEGIKMSDTIYRQAVIDRINELQEQLSPDLYSGDRIVDAILTLFAKYIEELPDAQPEPTYKEGFIDGARWATEIHDRLMDETGGKAVCKNEHWGRGDNNDE